MTMAAVTARTSRVPSRLSRMRCCQVFGLPTVGIGLMVEELSIVLPYFLGAGRRCTGELDVGHQLVKLRFEGDVTLHGRSAEDLAAASRLADAYPDATVREEEDQEQSDHQQRRAHPDEVGTRVVGHDQAGELAGALEGVAQAGDCRRL